MKLEIVKGRLNIYKQKLVYLSPKQQLNTKKQYMDDLSDKLRQALDSKVMDRKHMLAIYAERMKGISPLEKISKGFAYISDYNGKQISTIDNIKKGDRVNITMRDGRVVTKVEDIEPVDLPGVINNGR